MERSLIEGLSAQLGQASGLLSIVIAFAVGLLSTFTPCVYPLIPITLSIFGASGEVSRKRSFVLSLAYVFGIAVTYTVLGMVVASSGKYFGVFLGNPLVIISLCAILLGLSAYTLEIFQVGFAQKLQERASHVGGKGLGGAFLMGTVSGLVAAPCIGPPLATILLYAASASEGDLLRGGILLFAYSMGFGVPFLIIGTFREVLRRVPRAGNWLLWIKCFLAAAILSVALFFAAPLLKSSAPWSLLAGSTALLFFSFAFGLLLAKKTLRDSYRWSRLLASFLIAIPIYFFAVPGARRVSVSDGASDGSLSWGKDLKATLSEAQVKGTIVMADLYADWCIACKEFETKTFADPEVIQKLKSFSLVRIDFTSETKESLELSETYGIVGLPWILFLDGSGKELPNSTVRGFLEPHEFLEHLASLSR